MKIFFIDNFDSFSYNLVYELEHLDYEVLVYRNDIEPNYLMKLMNKEQEKPLLFLSPGPGNPSNSSNLLEIIERAKGHFPILGICLGLQALAQSYGAKIIRSKEIMHGKASTITLKKHEVFKGLGESMVVGRYHSLMASELPKDLEVIAKYQNIPMGIIHEQDKILAYQFHPESIMTLKGSELLKQSVEFLRKL
ncbi:aminodeoxychorismate/anthranilate synthase component II [Helicobacter cetorum]|uniref:Anthranilate synthase component II n=1 Tax=Helicobacter cetorum (strain ATCC BAA-540 / CCUG 52418 / MIT 99-5656) TaxID=1163745 RepID=I0EQC2_HELCM|nr:aminodeoxychorismate/anthranilate synthase component II [Helicobacter cetorum]AFI05141.1 anthranilate synthase component II [Helicobacter cetorum MIT 99-5656]